MAEYNKVRNKLIELCKEEGIEVRKGEYQILLAECEAYLAVEYKVPLEYAKIMLTNTVFEGLVKLYQSSRTKKWYIIIGEMMCSQSKGAVNGKEE